MRRTAESEISDKRKRVPRKTSITTRKRISRQKKMSIMTKKTIKEKKLNLPKTKYLLKRRERMPLSILKAFHRANTRPLMAQEECPCFPQ